MDELHGPVILRGGDGTPNSKARIFVDTAFQMIVDRGHQVRGMIVVMALDDVKGDQAVIVQQMTYPGAAVPLLIDMLADAQKRNAFDDPKSFQCLSDLDEFETFVTSLGGKFKTEPADLKDRMVSMIAAFRRWKEDQ